MSGKLDDGLRNRLLRGPLAKVDGNAALRAVQARVDGVRNDPLATTLFIDGQLALVDDMLHYFDRASMAHSLEVRVPFLDHHVVEYCATIPSRLKVRGRTTKYLLKEHVARGLIPDRIIDKRKVGFFAESIDGWFRAQTRGPVADYLLTSNPRCAEFLNPSAVRELVVSHADRSDTSNSNLLLAILMLEVWLSSYLSRAVPTPPSARAQIRIPA